MDSSACNLVGKHYNVSIGKIFNMKGDTDMKKSVIQYTAAVLVGALLIGGCGAGEKSKPEPEPESKIEQDESQASTETQEEEAELDIIPTVSITQNREEWHADDNETLLLTVSESKVNVMSEGFDALKSVIEARWAGLGSKSYDEELGWAKEHYETVKNDKNSSFANYSFDKNLTLHRNDSNIISFCESFYEFTGGAHGMYAVRGVTFDVKSGEELALEDIVSNPKRFYGQAIKYILKELDENYGEGLFPEYKEVVKESTFGETPASWYLDSAGIVINYDLYLIAPYAAGAPSVTLPYDEFAEYIKEEYIMPHDNMAAVVLENKDISMLLGESGKVMIETAYDEESSTSEVTVVSGSASEKVDITGNFREARVIKRNGRSFLIFACYYTADDFVTFVYEVTGGKVIWCDRIEGAGFGGGENSIIGSDKIELYVRSDVNGKGLGWIPYILNDDGRLENPVSPF